MKDSDNLRIERPTFVTHLECAMVGDRYPADQVHNLSKPNKPLLVRYDLAGVKQALTKDALAQRPPDLWRYRELLPVRKVSDIVSLGEATTPLIRLPRLAAKIGGEGKAKRGWFDTSTLKEPYRIEGKKTMGLELAEQLGWDVPDAIFYPTGGGTGLIGMWKAFAELEAVGFIGKKRPRMIAVQAAGCAPMVRAYEEGVEHARRWEDAHTIAAGIRVPQAVGDFLILRAVRERIGFANAADDEKISDALNEAPS